MPAFTGVLRIWVAGGWGFVVTGEVDVGAGELESRVGIEVDVGAVVDVKVVTDCEVVCVDEGGSVGKWSFSHSMVPPGVPGKRPIRVMTEPVVKAAVRVCVAGGHTQRSPLVMVVGLSVSSQATLC
jgi:hypothetical protein